MVFFLNQDENLNIRFLWPYKTIYSELQQDKYVLYPGLKETSSKASQGSPAGSSKKYVFHLI